MKMEMVLPDVPGSGDAEAPRQRRRRSRGTAGRGPGAGIGRVVKDIKKYEAGGW